MLDMTVREKLSANQIFENDMGWGVREQLLLEFDGDLTEDDFDSYSTDLYVRVATSELKTRVWAWIHEHYQHPGNCKDFRAQGAWIGSSAIEFPFAVTCR